MNDDETVPPHLLEMQGRIDRLFTARGIQPLLPPPQSFTERIAYDWLLQDGKRLRPLLTLAAYASLDARSRPGRADHAALAIELLHKASLIHDDIEDGDRERYGQPTMHVRYGLPAAVNAGDFLIGEAYRVLALGLDVPPHIQIALVSVAARGQRNLTIGQGSELEIVAGRGRLPKLEEYFKLAEYKTGNAFEVALLLGATLAEAASTTLAALSRYSLALGIAYQICDDLAELRRAIPRDFAARRPSILLTLAAESANPKLRCLSTGLWRNQKSTSSIATIDALLELMRHEDVAGKARRLARQHADAAQAALVDLPSEALRDLLGHVATILTMTSDQQDTE